MKRHRQPPRSAERVLRHPCPLPELAEILKCVDESEVQSHIRRLEQQLEVAEHEMARRIEAQRTLQQAEERRLRVVFGAMPFSKLKEYIELGEPNWQFAQRVLHERRMAVLRKAACKPPAADAPLNTPCEPGADCDDWRKHGC